MASGSVEDMLPTREEKDTHMALVERAWLSWSGFRCGRVNWLDIFGSLWLVIQAVFWTLKIENGTEIDIDRRNQCRKSMSLSCPRIVF